MFILVIWQRRSGTDESGAGRSCFATFPLPHRRGFPKTAFPHAVRAACPGPCDGGAIPGIGAAIPRTDPWCRREPSAEQQAQGGAEQIFWVLPAITNLLGHMMPSLTSVSQAVNMW